MIFILEKLKQEDYLEFKVTLGFSVRSVSRRIRIFFVSLFFSGCVHSTADRDPQLKSSENANIQPNPGLILRAEPTVTNILKVCAPAVDSLFFQPFSASR